MHLLLNFNNLLLSLVSVIVKSDGTNLIVIYILESPSYEHFDQHEQGRKYGTQQFREPLLHCDEHNHSVADRSGRASRIVTIRG